MRSLLDVNVLIALLDSDHSLHARTSEWFATHAKGGWASCPITQNCCIRIMSHPGYPKSMPVQTIAGRLAEAVSGPLHEFWPDELSLLDRNVAELERIHGPRQLTDAYLLALAVRRAGRFVTFDASIALAAIPGATKRHLLVL